MSSYADFLETMMSRFDFKTFRKSQALKPEGSTKVKQCNLTSNDCVRTKLVPETTLPVFFEAAVPDLSPTEWARDRNSMIEESLLRHGAVVLRGFAIRDVHEFDAFARAVSRESMKYIENTSPRTPVLGAIHTSTDYPPDQRILLHNEHSYSTVFPSRLLLFCETPAREGGETPLADCRKVLARLDPLIVARFQEKKYMYVRNFGYGIGPTWQSVFLTDSRECVEAHCRQGDIEFEWQDGDRLTTRQIRCPVLSHPTTGQPVWFNHIAFWHVSSLAKPVREALMATFQVSDLPNNTYYGNGLPIEPELIAAIRDAYERETIRFQWRAGDILMVDNMLVAHGRESYTGPRRILFTMIDPLNRSKF